MLDISATAAATAIVSKVIQARARPSRLALAKFISPLCRSPRHNNTSTPFSTPSCSPLARWLDARRIFRAQHRKANRSLHTFPHTHTHIHSTVRHALRILGDAPVRVVTPARARCEVGVASCALASARTHARRCRLHLATATRRPACFMVASTRPLVPKAAFD